MSEQEKCAKCGKRFGPAILNKRWGGCYQCGEEKAGRGKCTDDHCKCPKVAPESEERCADGSVITSTGGPVVTIKMPPPPPIPDDECGVEFWISRPSGRCTQKKPCPEHPTPAPAPVSEEEYVLPESSFALERRAGLVIAVQAPVSEAGFTWPLAEQTDHCSACYWYGDPVDEDKCPSCGATGCMTTAVGYTPETEWPSRASIDLSSMTPQDIVAELERLREIEENAAPTSARGRTTEALIEAAAAFLRVADRDTVLANNLRAAIAAATENEK